MATETMGTAEVTLRWMDIGGPRLGGFQQWSLTPSSISMRIGKGPHELTTPSISRPPMQVSRVSSKKAEGNG